MKMKSAASCRKPLRRFYREIAGENSSRQKHMRSASFFHERRQTANPAVNVKANTPMKAPPTILSNIPQPSRLPIQLASLALWLLIGINLVCFFCSLGAALATSKGEGVLWGSVIFALMFVAVAVAFLALPATFSHRRLVWPRFAFALGFTPLPLMAVVAQAVRLLRTLF
jgi:hypothetical protein